LFGGDVPANREAIWLSNYNTTAPLYVFIASLNIIRKRVIAVAGSYLNYNNYVTYNDSSTIVMRKGYAGTQVVTVLTNAGSEDPGRNFTLSNAMTGFNPGDLIIDLVSCFEGYIDTNGNILIMRQEGLPSIFYAKANIQGTTICVNGKTTGLNSVSGTSKPTESITSAAPGASHSHKSGATGLLDGLSGTMILIGFLSLSYVIV
jgi:alpha-amylase